MKKLIIVLTSLLFLSACNNERPVEKGMSIIPNIQKSVEHNEAVSGQSMKVMQEVYDYYFNNSFTEDEKKPYIEYISLKADLEIYNKFIEEENAMAADYTKERIVKKLEVMSKK